MLHSPCHSHQKYLEKIRNSEKIREKFDEISQNLFPLVNFDDIMLKFSQIVANVPKKQKIQECNSDNRVDFEKCCKMRLFSLS